MKTATLKAIVTRTLTPYTNKPTVTYGDDGHTIIYLNDGHWSAREDVENALRKHILDVRNYPTAKIIRIN